MILWTHFQMTLTQDGSYLLSIEIPAPIEFVLLQCNVPIKLLELEKSTAVVSFSKCDVTDGNHLLATYRCQVDKNRVDLKFRTNEGAYGTLQTFITPNIQPKVSQLQQFAIKALSLHVRVHSFDVTRPHNTLKLKGTFSHAEIHNWLNNCIPEVPEKFQTGQGDKSILFFQNIFIRTELMCEYWYVRMVQNPSINQLNVSYVQLFTAKAKHTLKRKIFQPYRFLRIS